MTHESEGVHRHSMVRGWRGSLKPVSRANSQSRSDNDGIPPTPDPGGIPTGENHDLEYVSIAHTRFYIQALGLFEEYDLLLTPQMPLTAWRVDDSSAHNESNPTPTIFDRLPFTFPPIPPGSLPPQYPAASPPTSCQSPSRSWAGIKPTPLSSNRQPHLK